MMRVHISHKPAPQPRLSRPKVRIGVLSPAGKVVNHDQVVTQSYGDPNKSVATFSNIGDSFVYESSLRILDFDELVPIHAPDSPKVRDQQVELVNSLDYVFLRGSNYINALGEWDNVTALLEQTKVPVIAFGIGLQALENAERVVNDSTERFLKLLAERSASIGVRGELSVAALEGIGITNVRIIGCPTAFRHRRATMQVKKVDSGSIEQLGFTLRRKTFRVATLQRYLMHVLSRQYRTTVFSAGELQEKGIFYADRGLVSEPETVRANAIKGLETDRWIYGADDPLLDIYRQSLAVFESVADFEEGIRAMSAVTGFRLHGNLMALANGVPALYVVYDTRTREFVRTFGIPFVEARSIDRFSFRDAWDKADFAKFERAYAALFKELRSFLHENGMPHRLETTNPASAAEETEAARVAA
jgi:Polysaccharide pyruvyl transferase